MVHRGADAPSDFHGWEGRDRILGHCSFYPLTPNRPIGVLEPVVDRLSRLTNH